MNLIQLKEEETGRIVDILGGHGMVKKLDALGIRIGIEVVKINMQFFKGPVIVQIGNTHIAIGYGMARRIIVEPVSQQKK